LKESGRALAVEFLVEQPDGSRGVIRSTWCSSSEASGWIPVGAQCGFDTNATDWPWVIN